MAKTNTRVKTLENMLEMLKLEEELLAKKLADIKQAIYRCVEELEDVIAGK